MSCEVCGSPVKYRCSRCKLMTYCSKEHLQTHWTVHKVCCQEVTTEFTKEYNEWNKSFKEYTTEEKGGILITFWNSIPQDERIDIIKYLIALVNFEKLIPSSAIKGGNEILSERLVDVDMSNCQFLEDWVFSFQKFNKKERLLILHSLWKTLNPKEKEYVVVAFV
ncbi:Uncharacterized protein QTN25_002184 [Entamoeba marina]